MEVQFVCFQLYLGADGWGRGPWMLGGVHHHCLNPGLWVPCGQWTRCQAEPEASGAEPPPPHSWLQRNLFLAADVACGQRRVGL